MRRQHSSRRDPDHLARIANICREKIRPKYPKDLGFEHWFVDGAFEVVMDPFYLLMSVHAFLKVGQQTKMMPLFFAVMYRRRKVDYVKIFRRLLESLPHPPAMRAVTMDFESTTWLAIDRVLPNVKVHGCVFHFTKAIWRKCQEFDLQENIYTLYFT
ncbi:uncharacterized protein [Haliotis asinina]|uniref:uncharacterized protein n=1 Tax=Haliotis asinina TaxID=109174 RepID=UPI003531D95F